MRLVLEGTEEAIKLADKAATTEPEKKENEHECKSSDCGNITDGMILLCYWRRHRGFKGFAVRGHSKRKRR